MNRKGKQSKTTPKTTESTSQTPANSAGRGNGGIDFDKLVAESHAREEEKKHITVEGKVPYIVTEKKQKETEPTEKEYKPYSVFPKGMVKQIAAFPFAGLDNTFRPYYPDMPSFYLTESESEELAGPLDVVLVEYSPILLSQYGALINLSFSVLMMVIKKSGWGTVPVPKQSLPETMQDNALQGDNITDAE